MKPAWTQTLAWLAAVAAAVLLAFGAPEATHFTQLPPLFPQGALAPR